MRRLVFIALVLGSVTCQQVPPQDQAVDPTTPPKPPEVLVGGCDAWFVHNVCESKGPLKVWVEGEAPTEVHLPGWTASEPTEVRGGFRVTLQPGPVGARGALTYGPRNVHITHVTTTTSTPVLDTLLAKMNTEDLLELAPTLALDGRAVVTASIRRRIHQAHGRANGLGNTRPTLERLIHLHRARNDTSQEVRFRAVASQAYAKAQQFGRAKSLLQQLPAYSRHDSNSEILANYYQGLLARDTGRPLKSAQHLSNAEEVANRAGNSSFRRSVALVMLPILSAAGLTHLRTRLQNQVLDDSEGLSCGSEAGLYTNIGWAGLLARESALGRNPRVASGPQSDQTQTTTYLYRAYELSKKCDASPYNSALNLAYDAVQRESIGDAARWLSKSSEYGEIRGLEIFRSLLSARLDLLRGQTNRARATYSGLLDAFNLSDLERWEAQTGLATSYLDEAPSKALELYRRAEDLVGKIGSRASLLTNQRDDASTTLRSSRALVDILASRGMVDEAWMVADRARQRLAAIRNSALLLANIPSHLRPQAEILRAKYSKARSKLRTLRGDLWMLPVENNEAGKQQITHQEQVVTKLMSDLMQLIGRPQTLHYSKGVVRPNDVHIMLFPGIERWWLLARFDHQTKGVPLEANGHVPSLSAVGDALSGVLPELTEVHEIRLLATGEIAQLDVHRSPVRGRPLGLQVAMTYSVGDGTTTPPIQPKHAVLLGDPAPHLQTASELMAVKDLLQTRGQTVQILAGAELEHAALLQSLKQADVIHFAGHAETRPGPFESRIRLGESRWLTAGDVVWVAKPNRRVVLAGCQTGAMTGSRPGWTLAEAFLASGAHEVLATQREVTRDLAQRVGRLVHDSDAPLSRQLLMVARVLHKESPDIDWSAFRVIVQ